MRRHVSFEWHEEKAEDNLRKHKVSFITAAIALADEKSGTFHVESFDLLHSVKEDRWQTIASIPADRFVVLVISWTTRGEITRSISARKANRRERKEYEREIETR